MGNLIKPADYAAKLGISRQAVYAKIKKGILTSRNVGGKIYVVMDKNSGGDDNMSSSKESKHSGANKRSDNKEQEKLLAAKDETISILKETIEDLKETNRMITSTLRGEVELLKDAFSEMKMLYSRQLEDKTKNDAGDDTIYIDESLPDEHAQEEWITLDDYYALSGIKKEKKQKKIKKRLKKRLKEGDPRVDRYNGEIVFLANTDIDDLLGKG